MEGFSPGVRPSQETAAFNAEVSAAVMPIMG